MWDRVKRQSNFGTRSNFERNTLALNFGRHYNYVMKQPWRITDEQWKGISRHLPDSGAYIGDKACFEALLHSIWRRHPIRSITELSSRHPGHSTLVPRIKYWEKHDLLRKMIKGYGKTLTPGQRNRFRDLLLNKAGWIGVFIDVTRPSKANK